MIRHPFIVHTDILFRYAAVNEFAANRCGATLGKRLIKGVPPPKSRYGREPRPFSAPLAVRRLSPAGPPPPLRRRCPTDPSRKTPGKPVSPAEWRCGRAQQQRRNKGKRSHQTSGLAQGRRRTPHHRETAAGIRGEPGEKASQLNARHPSTSEKTQSSRIAISNTLLGCPATFWKLLYLAGMCVNPIGKNLFTYGWVCVLIWMAGKSSDTGGTSGNDFITLLATFFVLRSIQAKPSAAELPDIHPAKVAAAMTGTATSEATVMLWPPVATTAAPPKITVAIAAVLPPIIQPRL